MAYVAQNAAAAVGWHRDVGLGCTLHEARAIKQHSSCTLAVGLARGTATLLLQWQRHIATYSYGVKHWLARIQIGVGQEFTASVSVARAAGGTAGPERSYRLLRGSTAGLIWPRVIQSPIEKDRCIRSLDGIME